MRDKFRRRFTARAKVRSEEDVRLDPIALSLAIWLGLVVAATGFVRVMQDAVAQARIAQDAARTAGKVVAAPQPAPLVGALPGTVGYAPLGG